MVDLAELVSSFSEVLFSMGQFAFENNGNASSDVIKEALDEYKEAKKGYNGDTSIYDNEINSTLDTFPDLSNIERV